MDFLHKNGILVLGAEEIFFFPFGFLHQKDLAITWKRTVSQKDSRGVGKKITVKAGVLNRKIIGDHEKHKAFS